MSSSAERFHFDDRFGHITTCMANPVIDAAYAAGQEAERERALHELRYIAERIGIDDPLASEATHRLIERLEDNE